MERKVRHHLYRHFSDDGELLYIGISINALARFQSHQNNYKKWIDDVGYMTIQRFETRDDLTNAEMIAIMSENPKYNKHHNNIEYVTSKALVNSEDMALHLNKLLEPLKEQTKNNDLLNSENRQIVFSGGKYNYSDDFIYKINDIDGNFGIYFIYDKNDKLIYIGKSKNLSQRITQSISERESSQSVYFYFPKTEADMHILEPYFINKMKPELNKHHISQDMPSFTIDIHLDINPIDIWRDT